MHCFAAGLHCLLQASVLMLLTSLEPSMPQPTPKHLLQVPSTLLASSASHLEPRRLLEAHAELDGKPAALFIGQLAALLVEGSDGCREAAVAQQHVDKPPLSCCLGGPFVKGLCSTSISQCHSQCSSQALLGLGDNTFSVGRRIMALSKATRQ